MLRRAINYKGYTILLALQDPNDPSNVSTHIDIIKDDEVVTWDFFKELDDTLNPTEETIELVKQMIDFELAYEEIKKFI
jgi:hypothetical protein